MNKFVLKLWCILKIHSVDITVYCAQHTRFIQDTTWYIFSSQDNGLWTVKHNSVLAWISIITSFLPLRITRKPDEFQVTICVAIVALSGIAHTLLSNVNIMKQNSNHALGRWNNQFATVMTKLFPHTSYAIYTSSSSSHKRITKQTLFNTTFTDFQQR